MSTRSSAGRAAAKELKGPAVALGCETNRMVPQKAITIATTNRIRCFFIVSPSRFLLHSEPLLLIFLRRAISSLLRIGFGHVFSLFGLAVSRRGGIGRVAG